MAGDAVVLHQLAFDFGIDIPAIARLIGAKVRKDKLRTFLRIIPAVILRYCLGAVARLVVGMVLIGRVNHAHVEGHLAGIVGGDEHLRLLLRF